MLYREIIAVCSQIQTKHINTLCGQNVELLNVKITTGPSSTETRQKFRCCGSRDSSPDVTVHSRCSWISVKVRNCSLISPHQTPCSMQTVPDSSVLTCIDMSAPSAHKTALLSHSGRASGTNLALSLSCYTKATGWPTLWPDYTCNRSSCPLPVEPFRRHHLNI